MAGGRPRKPVEQHQLEGTFRKNRHEGTLVITGERGLATQGPPAHLTKTQKGVWLELVECLDTIVRPSDAAVVEGAAVAFDQYRQAQLRINQDGLMTFNRFDEERPHPMIAVRDKALKLFLDFAGRLGLSPSDRARLGINFGTLAKTAQDLLEDRYGNPFEEPPEGEVIEVEAEDSDDVDSDDD